MSGESSLHTEEDAGLQRALDASLTVALLRRVYVDLLASPRISSGAERFATGFDRAYVTSVARRFARAARLSYLYRWFTAEPDPDVIVIDLRETYTVGPVIALLDSLFDWLAPGWQHSSCKRVTDGVTTVTVWAARTRAGRTIVRFLEPPRACDSREEE